MLKEYIDQGFGIREDLNCAEQILHGANDVYQLGLDKKCLQLAGGFGGGMAVEDACGVVTGACMVFSAVYIEERARVTPELKPVISEYIRRFEQELGTINCARLKDRHCREPEFCRPIISKGAEILDQVLQEHNKMHNKKV